MSDDKFTELVNLYLDNEISQEELRWLKLELAASVERRRAFEERCRLHQAMQLALNPQARRGAQLPRAGGRASVPAAGAAPLPRWLLGSGVAASFLMAAVLLLPIVTDPLDLIPGLEEVPPDVLSVENSLELKEADFKRYSAMQRQAARRQARGSLAAQFRLLGLDPGMTPRDLELEGVDMASFAAEGGAELSQGELLRQLQTLSPLPQPQLFEAAERPAGAEHGMHWSTSFEASLASFK